MPKPVNLYVAELNTTLDAIEAAVAAGMQIISITLDAWAPPRLLLVSVADLDRLPNACPSGQEIDGVQEWTAPWHGVTLTWYRHFAEEVAT